MPHLSAVRHGLAEKMGPAPRREAGPLSLKMAALTEEEEEAVTAQGREAKEPGANRPGIC